MCVHMFVFVIICVSVYIYILYISCMYMRAHVCTLFFLGAQILLGMKVMWSNWWDTPGVQFIQGSHGQRSSQKLRVHTQCFVYNYILYLNIYIFYTFQTYAFICSWSYFNIWEHIYSVFFYLYTLILHLLVFVIIYVFIYIYVRAFW